MKKVTFHLPDDVDAVELTLRTVFPEAEDITVTLDTWKSRSKHSIFKQGYSAGCPKNPYQRGTEEHLLWDGWSLGRVKPDRPE